MSIQERFDPKKHICKFGFELYDYAGIYPYKYNILGNLYQMEICIEFIDKNTQEVFDTIGMKISDEKLNGMLPIIVMDDFEILRDVPEPTSWDEDMGVRGYRDGWGYKFWCLSENGMPLLQSYMCEMYYKDMMPPHEKLLYWLRQNFNRKKHSRLKW